MTNDNGLEKYQTLLLHRQHAEKVFWSRIQTLHAIQAGILTGGFFSLLNEYPKLAIAAFSLGAVLSFMLGYLAYNDWSDAKSNQEVMQRLGDILGIRRTAKMNCVRKYLRSHITLFIIIGVFAFGDIAIAIWGKCLL
jgi:hypothetical protein